MDFHKFQFFNVLGAGIWVVSLVYGGYLFGNIPLIRANLGLILIVGIGAVVGPLMLTGLIRLLRRRKPARVVK
jgi:membrane-associated protein